MRNFDDICTSARGVAESNCTVAKNNHGFPSLQDNPIILFKTILFCRWCLEPLLQKLLYAANMGIF